MHLPPSLRALGHRNFRLFFFGQSVSLIGSWMQQTAVLWVVHLLTDSPSAQADSAFAQGVVAFAGQIPAFFIAPVAGVLVDRWNRQRLVVVTQFLAMLQAFALAGLALAGAVQLWHLIVLSVFIGVVNAFDMTGRQAFLREMIDNPDDLANAIALNSSMFNGARLVGPALATLALVLTSAGICFLANALSYLAVIAALLAMRVAPRIVPPRRSHLTREMREGLAYAFGFPPIRSLLLLLALMSMAGTSYTVFLPYIATHVLQGGKVTMGLLMTASAVGALSAASYLASRRTVLGLSRWLVIAPALAGVSLVLLARASAIWLALPLLAAIGFALMVYMGTTNTLLQTIVDEDKRGRVMSLYMMAFMGLSPLGGLFAGWLAGFTPEPGDALMVGGVACIAGSVAFAWHRRRLREFIRPIYVRMGILPRPSLPLTAGTVEPDGLTAIAAPELDGQAPDPAPDSVRSSEPNRIH
jgi:MFS family permease